MNRKIMAFAIYLGIGLGLMDYGTSKNIFLSLGTTIYISAVIYGIGWFLGKFPSSFPDRKTENIRKNTSRIYKLEKEVGIRDE